MDSALVSSRAINSASLTVDSVHDYLAYSKKMQQRLAEINNNVSSVIQESCTGIDNICNRVRQCLIEMDQRENKPPPRDLEQSDKFKDTEEGDISQDGGTTSDNTSQSLEDSTFGKSREGQSGEEAGQSGEEAGESEEEVGQSGNTTASEEDILKSGDTGSNPDTSLSTCNSINMEEKPDEEVTTDNEEPSTHKQILNKKNQSLKNKGDSASVLQEMENVGEVYYTNFKKTINTLCNNFEMMNELVESINKEITEFSETAIPENEEDKDIKKDNNVENKISPTEIPGKSRAQSETDLDMIDLVREDSTPLIIPDVYRKKAFTNLYEKLRAQVEASDSLMFFKTLMERQKNVANGKISLSKCKLNIPFLNYSRNAKLNAAPKTSHTVQPRAKLNLREKYAGSLWFSPKQILKDKSSRPTSKKTTSRRYSKRKNAVNTTIMKNGSNQIKNTPKTNSMKSGVQAKIKPSQFLSMENVAKKTCSLECPCNMVVKNELPASCRANKCQLQWLKAKPQAHHRRLKFIDMLDDLTNKDLLPLQSEYPRKDNERGRELDYKNIKETYLYKLVYGVQGTRNAWQHLFEPAVVAKNSKSGRSRSASCKSMRSIKNEKNFLEKICKQNCSKTEILKKLLPYIYDPEKTTANYCKPLIVMPVQVHYENFRNNELPTRLISTSKPTFNNSRLQKGSVSPSRELKPFKSTSFSHKTPKSTKVIFDGIRNKLELQPTVEAKQSPLISSARHCMEKPAIKQTTSKSFSPKSFTAYCADVKNCKREPLDVRYEQNVAIYNKIQADIETIKSEIYGKKCNKVDRKLWAHKYGRSVGQKLVSFVRNQQPEEFHVPKYALPNHQDRTDSKTTKDDSYPFRELCAQKEIIHINDQFRSKTEVIQSNIKKAIDVIEGRMVDILCNNSDSVEAFDIMEKEITNILNMMKCKGQINDLEQNKDQKPKDALEERYQVISDNLFERLEKILTSESSSLTIAKKEVMEKPKKEHEPQKKQKVPRHVEQPKKEKEPTKKHKILCPAEETKKENGEVKKQKIWSSKRSKLDNPLPSTTVSLEKKKDKKCSSRSSKKEAKLDSKCKQGRGKPAIAQSQEHVEPMPEANIILNELRQVINNEMVESVSVKDNGTAEVTMDDIAISQDTAVMDSIDPNSTFTIENNTSEDKVEKLEESDAIFSSMESYNAYKSKIFSQIDDIINKQFNEEEDPILDTELPNVQNDKPEEVLIEKSNVLDDSLNTDEEKWDQNNNEALFVQDEKGEDNNSEMENEDNPIQPSDKEICLEREEFTETESCSVQEETVKCEVETVNENAQPVQQFSDEEKEDHSTPKTIESSSDETFDNQNISHRPDEDTYSVHMHKIIKRVEDIYSQLDDINDCESSHHIPVFRDVTVPDVPSEDFLTPFMQVVKETREISKINKEHLLEKSPSYYNIMSFLDALSSIQQEVANEVYTVRMINYPIICPQTTVYAQAIIWEQAKYLTSNHKTGCLKRSLEDVKQNKQKKVSFFDIMRHQSSQATLCPYHKIKVVKISSQQFPPIETGNETTGQSLGYKNDNQSSLIQTDTKTGVTDFNKGKIDQSDFAISYRSDFKDEKNSEELKNLKSQWIRNSQQNDHATNEERISTADNIPMKLCEVHGKIPCTSHWVGGPEKKKEPELSVVGDKSTQVFCQMQNQTDNNSSEENVCLLSKEQPLDRPICEENDPNDSKSTEHDSYYNSQMDPLFDYANEIVTPSVVMQKVNKIYDENSKLAISGQTPPKIVVFREVVEKPNLPLESTFDRNEIYRKLEKRREVRLLRRQSTEVLKKHDVPEDRDNVVLLKSFYAIVYILMFTALSLDYRCL